MNCLLDTHALLWSLFSPEKLGRRAADALRLSENGIAVSAVSFWEISLKCALGKLELRGVTPEDLPDAAIRTGFDLLPLAPEEAASFHRLPLQAHRDPFDRLIIWQAISRGLTLVTRDRSCEQYRALGLRTIW